MGFHAEFLLSGLSLWQSKTAGMVSTLTGPYHEKLGKERGICSTWSLLLNPLRMGMISQTEGVTPFSRGQKEMAKVQTFAKWLWVKNRYPNGTLVHGNNDYNLWSPGGLILTHTQMPRNDGTTKESGGWNFWRPTA